MPILRLALVGLLVALLSACGPSGASQPAVGDPLGLTPTPVAMGQAMTANHHAVRLLDYHRSPSTRSGKECVQVAVSLTNADTSPWPLPLAQMQLLDARAFVYYHSDSCGTSTNLQTLDPGQSAAATLYFEVLANAVVDFEWTPNVGNLSAGYSTALK
jgi:hypothetical protein